jgi:type II secretory pathway component PulC
MCRRRRTGPRITSTSVNGRRGIRLQGIRLDTIFAQTGLEDGDVLLEVNGTGFTTPEDALRIYDRLRGADDIRIEIVRGGRPMLLRYQIVR